MASTLKHLLKHWIVLEDGGMGDYVYIRRIGPPVLPSQIRFLSRALQEELKKLSDDSLYRDVAKMVRERLNKLRASEDYAWVEQPPTEQTSYLFVKIIDMVNACGNDTLGQPSMVGEVWLVSPSDHGHAQMDRVFRSCGWRECVQTIQDWLDENQVDACDGDDPEIIIDRPDFLAKPPKYDIGQMFAEMLESYGCKANLHSSVSDDTVTEKNFYNGLNEEGRPFKALLRELLVTANEYAADAAKLNDTLDTKIVNRLGQTARQAASGDVQGYLVTLKNSIPMSELTPAQRIIMKMYGVSTHTLDGTPIDPRLRS